MKRPVRVQRLELISTPPLLSREDFAGLGLPGLQFGCGDSLHESCLNTDACWLTDGATVTERGRLYRVDGRTRFVQLDARERLPFRSSSFEWVYSEHFVEHLKPGDAISWLQEVRRVLVPGGTLRVTTPDLRRYVDAYLDPGDRFFRLHRERIRAFGVPDMDDRKAFMLNQIFQFWGHRWIYDADELRHAVGEAGFPIESFRICEFRQGSVPAAAKLDMEVRNDETIYVEVTA
jgi:predicted SAM-dependent methyltransferase